MTERDAADWARRWIEAQRDYVRIWTEGATVNRPHSPELDLVDPWSQALEQWWQAAAPAKSDAAQDLSAKIVAQAKEYSQLAAGLVGAMDSATMNATPDKFAVSGVAQTLIDIWKKAAATTTVWQNYDGGSVAEIFGKMVHEGMEPLAIPGIGKPLETQDQLQKLAQRGIKYQQAWRDYLQFQGELAGASLKHMEETLMCLVNEGKTIDTYRELYDLWVECSEQVYAERVASDRYADIFGGLVNSLMAYRVEWSRTIESMAEGMGLPTHTEINTMSETLQTMQRQMTALRRRMDRLQQAIEAVNTDSSVTARAKVSKRTRKKRPATAALAKQKRKPSSKT